MASGDTPPGGPVSRAGGRDGARLRAVRAYLIAPAAAVPLAAWCTVLALASIGLQGFEFAINNNEFHIPIVLGLTRLPQFAHDAFVQSLGGFASAFWLAVAQITTEANIRSVFLALHLLARILTLFSFGIVLRSLGCAAGWRVALATAVLALSPLLMRGTEPGGADLLPNFLTHSEFVHPCILLAFAALLRGRPLWAYVCIGVMFNVNAFAALWLAFVVAAAQLLLGARTGVAGAVRAAAGALRPALVAAALAAPTIGWLLWTMRTAVPAPPGFDYAHYLWEYFPDHVMIAAATPGGILQLASKSLIVCASIAILRDSRAWGDHQVAVIAALSTASMTLLLLGMALPFMTHSMIALNLNLIRSDLLLHWLALLSAVPAVILEAQARAPGLSRRLVLCATAATLALGVWPLAAAGLLALWLPARLQRGRAALAAGTAALGLGVTLGGTASLYLAAALLLLALGLPRTRTARAARLLLSAAAAVAAAYGLVAATPVFAGDIRALRLGIAGGFSLALAVVWLRLARRLVVDPRWAAALASACVVLVVGQASAKVLTGRDPAAQRTRDDLVEVARWMRSHTVPDERPVLVPLMADADIRWIVRRPIWVDWKEGAAVMWSPAFYRQWHLRSTEVSGLRSLDDQLIYACRRDIPYVVTRSPGAATARGAAVLFSRGDYRLFAVAPACSLAGPG